MSALHEADHKSRSLPDIAGSTDWRLADETDRNGSSYHTSTSNEGTPRLLPTQNGSSNLISIVASDTNALDFPKPLLEPTLVASHSNIVTPHHAIPAAANANRSHSLSNSVTLEKHPQISSLTSLSSNRNDANTLDSRPFTRKLVPATVLGAESNGNITPSLGMETRKRSDSKGEKGEKPGSNEEPHEETKGVYKEATNVGGTSLDNSHHVKKGIGAALVEAEPAINARSRKSSHMMQLFKDTSPEQQKPQGKKSRVVPQERGDSGTNEDLTPTAPPEARQARHSGSSSNLEGVDKKEQEIIPLQHSKSEALEEPMGFGLEKDRDRDQQHLRAFHDLPNQAREYDTSSPRPAHFPHRLLAEIRNHPYEKEDIAGGEEEDGFDKDHVSSAIYYPHKAPSPDTLENTIGNSCRPGQRDHYVKLSRSGVRSPLTERDDPLQADGENIATSSRASDSGLSSASDSESSHTDGETTPKASPVGHHTFLGSRPRKGRRPQTVPVPAIELKPFTHQVGGHTIFYKFHKKGVTKPLTNEENKFYELIELAHPELLEFLTGYVYLLVVG